MGSDWTAVKLGLKRCHQRCSERWVDMTKLAARQKMLRNALTLMEDALELLDDADCAADIGAHLDLAICRLRDFAPDASSAADCSRIGERERLAK